MGIALVTGASRGLGAGIVSRLLGSGYDVIAARRTLQGRPPATTRGGGGPPTLRTVTVDVDDQGQIERMADQVGSMVPYLDVLVNNAGTGVPPSALGDASSSRELGHLRAEALLALFRTNAVAPVLVAQVLRPLLARSANGVIVNITSVNACFATPNDGGHYGYRSSKAAMNMLTSTLAADLRPDGITVIAIHPGWVRTRLGGPNGELSVDEAATGVVDVATAATIASSGLLFDWRGRQLPW